MYKKRSFLAIIPARSGSKGIPGKNIREIGHKPLMAYTIEACINAGIFDDIIVSTDSMEYGEIAEQYGASVPFLRPKELSSDQASTNDVILHAIKERKQAGKIFDYFMLLQPTSPLRRESHIIESADVILNNQADSVIGICPYDSDSYLTVQITDTGEIKPAFLNKKQVRRQDFPTQYRINGAIYLASTNYFLKHQSFYEGRTLPYIMNQINSIDIDDEFQFQMAEFLLLKTAASDLIRSN